MESEFIRWLRGRAPGHRHLPLGIGDDAAIVRTSNDERLVVTVDMVNDGVDFDLSQHDPARAGRKALAVNLSDLAAMAARPLAAVVALALPHSGALSLAQRLYEGLLPLAAEFDVAIAGGDTNCWNGPLAMSITLFGELHQNGPLLRSGAKSGDSILVTGSFGGSILGHHFDFQPRVREAQWLMSHYPLHAGMDVSDGLSLDLSRIAVESGCGAVIELAKVPLASAAARLARELGDGSTALDHALGDGEDFELILAVPPEVAEELLGLQPLGCPLSCLGRFVAEPGLWQQDKHGARSPLAPRGYEHQGRSNGPQNS